ncbi:MAG: S46 family peptidase [Elusimicrobia bacterium]|nr:S46 family peptidase [Elusimicrobiota bacterium]
MKKTSAAPPVLPDEGMWTFDNPPLKTLRREFGWAPPKRWLDRLRLASVRFNDGGSGAFVSRSGLVLTNHHVAMGQLQKMSTAARDFVKDGFYARTRAAERPCPDLELNVLISYEDVTRRVRAALPDGMAPAAAAAARRAVTAAIEAESAEATGLRSDVIELYQGGEYWLYRYKKYTDIRLVMAPEVGAAFYGGDDDNFTYPRYALDFAFFRAFEGGRPVRPAAFLPLHPAGPVEGRPLFVSGHPGGTDRLLTQAQLDFERRVTVPERLALVRGRLEATKAFQARSPEAARRGRDHRFSLENADKALTGEAEGLNEPALLERKAAEERALRAGARGARSAWERIARARRAYEGRFGRHVYRRLSGGRLAGFADAIVRWVVEVEKPNEKRFEEFRDSGLDSLRHRLYSPAPVYKDFEEAMLAHCLEEMAAKLGPGDPCLRAALAGRSPREAARLAVRGTRLDEPKVRRMLVEGGRRAVESSRDPLILLARRVDPFYRAERKWHEDAVDGVERLEGRRIAEARFKLWGRASYPDATFTLRLSHGRAAGYAWTKTLVPWFTTFHGLFDRAASFQARGAYRLPERVRAAKGRIRLETPLDFVSTNDIIGGNSGSPVVDRAGRCVGLIFDGNVQSLTANYGYPGGPGRAVSVHAGGICEALRAIYRMPGLLRELGVSRA